MAWARFMIAVRSAPSTSSSTRLVRSRVSVSIRLCSRASSMVRTVVACSIAIRSESPAVPSGSRTASTPIGAPPSTATETSRSSSRIGLAAAIARASISFRRPGSARGYVSGRSGPAHARRLPNRSSMAAERPVSSYTARAMPS